VADLTQIAGNVVQGIAGYEAGKYNRDAAYNAAIEEESAGVAEEASRDEARHGDGEGR